MGDMDWNFGDQDQEQTFNGSREFEPKRPDHPNVISDRKWREEGKLESWRDMASRTVAALGCLVIWSPKPLSIGAIARRLGTSICAEPTADQPFVVIGEATKDHYDRQQSFVGCDPGCSRDQYYYFVQTD